MIYNIMMIVSIIVLLVVLIKTIRNNIIEKRRTEDFIETCKRIEGQIRKKNNIGIDTFDLTQEDRIKYEQYDEDIQTLIDNFSNKHSTADMKSIIAHYNGKI